MFMCTALLLQSCLHDDNEIFDKSASERLSEAVATDKAILQSSSNGWALHFFTEKEYQGIGLTYLMKFGTDGKVTVSSEMYGADETRTSSYDIITDQGPVLTFNTYNEIFHELSNPSMQDDDGEGADYEFVVLKATQDTILLQGKKFKNEMYLTRIPEGQSWDSYYKAIESLETNIPVTYKLNAGGETVGEAQLDPTTRRASINLGKEGVYETPYCVNPDGIVLGEAFEGAKWFSYDESSVSFNAKNLKFSGVFTPAYIISKLGGKTLGLGDDAGDKIFDVTHAESFSFTTDADWLKASATDKAITLNAAANNTGHPRTATLYIQNDLGVDSLVVNQADFDKDLAGLYTLSYYDSDNNQQKDQAMLSRSEDGSISFVWLYGNSSLWTSSVSWDANKGTLSWGNSQCIGTVRNTYYCFNLFRNAAGNYSTSTAVSADLIPGYDKDGTYLTLGGQIGSENIASMYVLVAASATNPSFLGYWDIVTNFRLIKSKSSSKANAKAAFESVKRPENLTRTPKKIKDSKK